MCNSYDFKKVSILCVSESTTTPTTFTTESPTTGTTVSESTVTTVTSTAFTTPTGVSTVSMETTTPTSVTTGTFVTGWRCSSVVERRSLTGELSLACTGPAADG